MPGTSDRRGTRQLLFVQGGGKDTHDAWDSKLVASLRQALGPAHAIRYPRMPAEADPVAAAWKSTIARELRTLGDDVCLVGHSIGAAILLDYLADGPPERQVAGVFLIAAPFIGDGGWPSADLRPTTQAALALRGGAPLCFYQGDSDETVPASHVEMFATAFPDATIRRLKGRDHQLDDDLSEVARDITLLGSSR
jgi:predicted alpha/beta hydrolase family esterase